MSARALAIIGYFSLLGTAACGFNWYSEWLEERRGKKTMVSRACYGSLHEGGCPEPSCECHCHKPDLDGLGDLIIIGGSLIGLVMFVLFWMMVYREFTR